MSRFKLEFSGVLVSIIALSSCSQMGPILKDGKLDRNISSDNSKALEVCESIPFTSDKNNCVNVVSGVAYFDNDAVSLCSSIAFSSDKVECLKIIANKQFSKGVPRACTSPFSSSIIQCLKGAKEASLINSESKHDLNYGKTATSPGKLNAYCVSVPAGMASWGVDFQKKCHQLVLTGGFVDSSAFKSCLSLQASYANSVDQVKCIEVILSNQFDTDVENCSRKLGANAIIICLNEHMK